MAEKKESNVKLKTRVAVLLTGLYLGVIAYFRGSDAWYLLREGDLNVLGDFLAGILTPVALFWLIFGYFLQKDEFSLQRRELEQTRETLGEQVTVLKEQAEADRQRSMPMLILEKDNSVITDENGVKDEDGSTNPHSFLLRNIGGPARHLEITSGTDGRGWATPPRLLDKDETYPVHISNPFSSFDLFDLETAAPPSSDQPCRVRFLSERHESFEQRWSIRFTAQNSHAPEIKEITDGPIPARVSLTHTILSDGI